MCILLSFLLYYPVECQTKGRPFFGYGSDFSGCIADLYRPKTEVTHFERPLHDVGTIYCDETIPNLHEFNFANYTRVVWK